MNKPEQPAIRRYFFDTEFNDNLPGFSCDFISIGIVDEAGEEYYGISNEFNLSAAQSDPWLKEHIIDKLDEQDTWEDIKAIRENILSMIKPADVLELWAKNGSYDNVMICQIFGGMGALRKAFQDKGVKKVSFRDSNELAREMPHVKIWQRDAYGAHISINDARHERFMFGIYEKVRELEQQMPPVHLPDTPKP